MKQYLLAGALLIGSFFAGRYTQTAPPVAPQTPSARTVPTLAQQIDSYNNSSNKELEGILEQAEDAGWQLIPSRSSFNRVSMYSGTIDPVDLVSVRKKFKPQLQTYGLPVPQVRIAVPKATAELQRRPYNAKELVVHVIDTMDEVISWDFILIEPDKRKHFLRSGIDIQPSNMVSLDIDPNQAGTMFAVTGYLAVIPGERMPQVNMLSTIVGYGLAQDYAHLRTAARQLKNDDEITAEQEKELETQLFTHMQLLNHAMMQEMLGRKDPTKTQDTLHQMRSDPMQFLREQIGF